MRIVPLLLVAAAVSAQEVDLSACRPTPEVQRALNAIPATAPLAQLPAGYFAEQKPRLEALAQRYPRDLFVQRRLVRFLREGLQRSRSGSRALPGWYRMEWEKDRKDPLRRYLLAEATRQTYPAFARRLLDDLLKEHPDFPWAHFALAENYRDVRQPDNGRAVRHALRLTELCPDLPEGFELLRGLFAPASLADVTAFRLRQAVEALPWEVRLQWMPTLWDLEIQGLDEKGRAQAVAVVEEDLVEIVELGRADRAEWFEAIQAGAGITGNVERSTWAKRELGKRKALDPGTELIGVFGRWRRENAPPAGADWARIQDYYRRSLAESERWVTRWPTLEQAWTLRLQAATGVDELPAETVMAIGAAALEARERAFDDWYRPELRYDVARMYLKHGVRLEQVERLAAQPVQDAIAEHRASIENDPGGPPSVQQARRFEEGLSRSLAPNIWASNVLRAHWAWRVGNAETLAGSLAALRKAAPSAPEGADGMRMEEFARKRVELSLAKAWAADSLGDVDAASAAYAEAVRSRPRFTEEPPFSVQGDPYFGEAVHEQARRYWAARGKSASELAAVVGDQSGITLGARRTDVVWFKRIGPPALPADFDVTDLNGRRWTRADFIGKPGLLATWPARLDWYWKNLASLAQGIDRSTPFLALAVDGNAAMFEQVAKREKLSFAIAPADLPLVQRLTHGTAAAQVCLVDARGNMVKCAVGPFPTDGSALPEFRRALDEAR